MSLTSDLISQFVKVTKDDNKTKNETTVYGTIVASNGTNYVQLDGSELLTPISTAVSVAPGERVMVTIKNHTAVVTGNMSSPAARVKDLDGMDEAAKKIEEFEIIVSYRVTAEDIQATNAILDRLIAKTANITNLEAVEAAIYNLRAKYAELEYVHADELNALNAEIESLRAIFGGFADLSTEELDAINAEIDNLSAYNANFTYVAATILQALKAEINRLDVDKLSASEVELKFANVDFSNIGKAAMEYFYANSGLIQDVTVGDSTITGRLVGVTISGDLIEGNTVKAEKLVIKGSDGLYYKLNTDGMTTEAQQTDENSLNGSIIKAGSITASKINVTDLVAFGATIGGFNISENSVYSGAKSTVGNTTRGIYMDKDGQIAFGDSNNYVKFYKDANGNYKLAISAESIFFGSSQQTAADISQAASEALRIAEDLEKRANDGEFGGGTGAATFVLSITSSNGTIFKNSAIETVLTAHVYKGGQELTADEIAEYGVINWYKDGDPTPIATGATLNIDAGDVTSRSSYVATLEAGDDDNGGDNGGSEVQILSHSMCLKNTSSTLGNCSYIQPVNAWYFPDTPGYSTYKYDIDSSLAGHTLILSGTRLGGAMFDSTDPWIEDVKYASNSYIALVDSDGIGCFNGRDIVVDPSETMAPNTDYDGAFTTIHIPSDIVSLAAIYISVIDNPELGYGTPVLAIGV